MQEQPKNDTDRQIKKLIKQLSSWKTAKRIEAAHELLQIGPDAMDALRALLHTGVGARRRDRVGVSILFVYSIIVLLSATMSNGLFYILLNLLVPLLLLVAWTAVPSVSERNIIRSLINCDNPYGAVLLIEATEYPDDFVRLGATAALVRILSRMQAIHVSLIDEMHRLMLYRLLETDNTELVLAILRALPQFEDGKALPYVESLAAGKGNAAKDKRVIDAACGCLQILREYAERERASKALVRAASDPDTDSQALLRASGEVTNSSPDQLLRASIAEQDE